MYLVKDFKDQVSVLVKIVAKLTGVIINNRW